MCDACGAYDTRGAYAGVWRSPRFVSGKGEHQCEVCAWGALSSESNMYEALHEPLHDRQLPHRSSRVKKIVIADEFA